MEAVTEYVRIGHLDQGGRIDILTTVSSFPNPIYVDSRGQAVAFLPNAISLPNRRKHRSS